jgi:lipid-binding SYLF domain-containing protein
MVGLFIMLAGNSQAALFGPKGDNPTEKKATIRAQRSELLAKLYAAKPEMKNVIEKAAGYATFNQVNINLLLLATANGYGMAVDNKTRKETFMRMGSLGGGVGAGVKDVRVVFVFHSPDVMKRFIEEGWQFGGQADAAAKYKDTGLAAEQDVKAGISLKDGTVSGSSASSVVAGTDSQTSGGGSVTTRGGMEVFQFTEAGVALQATVGGTKYWKDAKLNK